jgi:ribonuclease P protein subunit POP4
LEGIIVRDTRFTFEIITKNNTVKSIPKEHTILRFEVPLPDENGTMAMKPLVLELNAEQFQTRAADRANKKFRMHYQPDI